MKYKKVKAKLAARQFTMEKFVDKLSEKERKAFKLPGSQNRHKN